MPAKQTLNPRTTEYEFLGPVGAGLMITLLPAVLYILHLACTPEGCPPLSFFTTSPSQITSLFTPQHLDLLFDAKAFLAYMGFLAYLILAWYVVPGRWMEGTLLRNGERLKYKENSFRVLLLTTVLMAGATVAWGDVPLLFVFDHFMGIVTSSVIVSFTLAAYVYLDSFRGERLLALGGNSGNMIYDYMIGRELNPRIGNFDIKFFVELLPGLFSWLLMDLAMAAKQYGDLGRLTASMVLVLTFHAWYCLDALYNEETILLMMDITTDGFGWMLSFGNLSWLAFLYGLQARYLALRPVELSWLQIVVIISLQAVGYSIFRQANDEKSIFRKNPNDPRVKDLKYITTESGSKLLISGWWGRARHINYLADWLMAWAWCLPCGFDDIFPYFYVIYFGILLVHRELRDASKCQKKYKKDWDRYCEIVRWRIIPGIY